MANPCHSLQRSVNQIKRVSSNPIVISVFLLGIQHRPDRRFSRAIQVGMLDLPWLQVDPG